MLIPLGTERPSSRPTLVTPLLIVMTIGCFVAIAILSGVDPERAKAIEQSLWVVGGRDFRWWQPFTSTLLHAGLLHLAGNMLFLWVFGPSVESRFGRLGFLGLYLGSALLAGLLHAAFARQVVMGLSMPVPAVGASGAIAGVTGSFLVLFPRTQVRCFTFLGFGIIAVPAWWFVGFAILWDLFSQGLSVNSGVAHLAHLGGYAAGFGLSMLLLWLKVFPREPYDLFTLFRQAHRRRQFREAGVHHQQALRKAMELVDKPDPQREAIAHARMKVSQAASSGDTPAAAAEYVEMLASFGLESKGTTLTRQVQYEIANHLFQTGDHVHAAVAYERFLEAYPSDREEPTVRLMLGLIYARYLKDPVAAKGLIEKARADLDDDHRALADELLEEMAS